MSVRNPGVPDPRDTGRETEVRVAALKEHIASLIERIKAGEFMDQGLLNAEEELDSLNVGDLEGWDDYVRKFKKAIRELGGKSENDDGKLSEDSVSFPDRVAKIEKSGVHTKFKGFLRNRFLGLTTVVGEINALSDEAGQAWLKRQKQDSDGFDADPEASRAVTHEELSPVEKKEMSQVEREQREIVADLLVEARKYHTEATLKELEKELTLLDFYVTSTGKDMSA